MKVCHKCQTPWEGEARVDFKTACPKCFAYLHCCRNCRLHDPLAHNQCKSSTTEPVEDRQGPNFCDEFEFKEDTGQRESPRGSGKDKWDKMFGGK